VTRMEQMERLVDDLYAFRDQFFETHSLEMAKDKPGMLQDKLEKVLTDFEGLNLKESPVEGGRGDNSQNNENANQEDSIALRSDLDDKAKILYFRGRALNVTTDHSPESESLLSKAVKLEPSFVEAWNELGECYWKRAQVDNAQNCFEGALNHRQNKVSLRSLSIVMRQKTSGQHEDRVRNIEAGLSKARDAVQLDTSDGFSWSILGNAYLAHFFSVSQNPRTLKQAMTAYKQAEKDVRAKSSPELHYNKGIALKFEEDYKTALNCFSTSKALDPTWDSATAQENALLKHLNSIQQLLENRGKLKIKKFNTLVESIKDVDGGGEDGGGSCKHLGPYSTKARTSSGSKVFQQVDFDDLTEGTNTDKVILGKVICSVHSEESVPFTFCLTDRTSRCLAVNLYNVAPGKGVIIGDSVAIAEPTFKRVQLEHNGQAVKFDLVRVDSPLGLVINGKKANSDFQAGIQLSTFTKND